MSPDGLTQPELAAYLRRLARLETEELPNFPLPAYLADRAFLSGRASALRALADLVERGEISGGLFAGPIHRLHRPPPDASMPDD